MLSSEKDNHPWGTDMRRGDVQCPFVTPNDNGVLCCIWREGHPADLPHETAYNQPTPPPTREWYKENDDQ